MIILCIALHLYHGPIAPETNVTTLQETCISVPATELSAVVDCDDAQRCEWLTPPASVDVVRVEYKLQD